jgi:hypothetical protein
MTTYSEHYVMINTFDGARDCTLNFLARSLSMNGLEKYHVRVYVCVCVCVCVCFCVYVCRQLYGHMATLEKYGSAGSSGT